MNMEDFISLYEQQLSIIHEFKKTFHVFGDATSEAQLEDALKNLNAIKKEHECSLAALTSLPEPNIETAENAEELFQEALRNIEQKKETKVRNVEEVVIGDNSIILSQIDVIPTDPITKCKIKDPARNKICNHVYEHSIIMDYIKSKSRSRSNRNPVKCPYIGCANNNTQISDIVIDSALRAKIRSMEFNESLGLEQGNQSTVDLD